MTTLIIQDIHGFKSPASPTGVNLRLVVQRLRKAGRLCRAEKPQDAYAVLEGVLEGIGALDLD